MEHLVVGTQDLVVTGVKKELNEADNHLHVKGAHNEKVDQKVSLTFGMDLHEKIGMNYAHESGMTIYIKAGMTMVLEAGPSPLILTGGSSLPPHFRPALRRSSRPLNASTPSAGGSSPSLPWPRSWSSWMPRW